ncbi:MAG: diphthine--ammonia ligase [Balneolaceae bacterium]|nr:diphthine--ammonia ligase [Balneolaceae bacterium]
MKHKTVFHWSGGKDSSLALLRLLRHKSYSVERLLTTVDQNSRRIAMHGVREELLHVQAESIGIPLTILQMPDQPDMETYNKRMGEQMQSFREQGFTHAAFGDIYLEDLKQYRENEMKKAGFKSVFPIWKEDTKQLASQFTESGFSAITVCVDSAALPREFAGREADRHFFENLPVETDPCGENGEFHTFVYEGPIFQKKIPFKKKAVTYKKIEGPNSSEMGFWYCDLLPVCN